MDQHRVHRRVMHCLLDLDNGLDGDDDGWGFVGWHQDPNVPDTRFLDIFIELGRMLCVDEGAVGLVRLPLLCVFSLVSVISRWEGQAYRMVFNPKVFRCSMFSG